MSLSEKGAAVGETATCLGEATGGGAVVNAGCDGGERWKEFFKMPVAGVSLAHIGNANSGVMIERQIQTFRSLRCRTRRAVTDWYV
jgi:hypothetical protein